MELDFALAHGARNRRGARWIRTARERQMPFARQEPGGGVEADPTGTRQIHLAPRMQVGEIAVRPTRPINRLDIGDELNQVTGDESRGQAEVAEHLDQQPGRVPAGARTKRQCLFRCLHTRLEPDDIPDVLLKLSVDVDERVNRATAVPPYTGHVVGQPRPERIRAPKRLQLVRQRLVVHERKVLAVRLEKEIERVVHRHLGDKIDLDAELAHPLRKGEPRDVVALGILLPVDEVMRWRDALRVRQHRRPAMRGRAKTHELRRQLDISVVAVVRHMTKGDMYAHGMDAAKQKDAWKACSALCRARRRSLPEQTKLSDDFRNRQRCRQDWNTKTRGKTSPRPRHRQGMARAMRAAPMSHSPLRFTMT